MRRRSIGTAAALLGMLLASPAVAGWEAYDATGRYLGTASGQIRGEHDGRAIWIGVNEDGSLGSSDSARDVYFEEPDCSGQAYSSSEPHGSIWGDEVLWDGTTYYDFTGPAVLPTVASVFHYGRCDPASSGGGDFYAVTPLDPQPLIVEPIEARWIEPVQAVSVSALGGQLLALAVVFLAGIGVARARRHSAEHR
jgi:hypothetical protein